MNVFLRRGYSLVLLLALCNGRLLATPKCPIVTQNFSSSANGATIDTTATGWYIDASALSSPTYFAVKSSRFTAENIGGVGVWYSRIFPVTGYASFQVAVKITAEGLQTSSEYVKIYYKLNGGPETLYAQDSANFGTLDFTSAALTANTVQLVVRIYDYNNGSGQSSKYYIEQYRVFNENGPCTPTTIPVSAAISSSNQVLTCTNSSVTLAASSTASGVSYSWTGPNGFTSTSATPAVTAAGTYEVIGSSSAGSGAAVVTVSANNAAPDLTAAGGALGCSASVTLSAASSVSGVTYSWTNASGTVISTSATASVSALGNYTVKVTNPANGCTNQQTVQVVSGNATPTTFWNEDFSDLADSTKTDTGATPWTTVDPATTGVFAVINHEFRVSNIGNTSVGVWTSGSINISGRTNVSISVDVRSGVSTGGALESSGSSVDSLSLYYILNGGTPVQFSSNLGAINNNRTTDTTISIGSLNGSTLQVMVKSRTTSFDEFFYFDNVKVSGILQTSVTATASNSGPVTCKPDSVTLLGSSTTAGVSYAWTGPNSFSSSLQNPKVRATGTYTLTVTNSGGCNATASTSVTQNTTAPTGVTASSSSGSTVLTCTNSSLTLKGSSGTTGVSYAWTGPNGFTATGSSASASAAGTYTLTATDTSNGCSAAASVALQSNTAAPASVTYIPTPASAQLTCAATSVSLAGSSATTTARYSWSGPNNYSATGANASASTAGTYTLTATDTTNGCTATATAVITQNTAAPVGLTATVNQQLTCLVTTVTLTGSSTTAGVTYSWTGPNSFTASTAHTQTSAGGIYTLHVTDPTNGCSQTLPLTVSQNIAPPANVTATNSGPLTCDITQVTLTGTTSTVNAGFEWDGPNGYQSFSAQDVATDPGAYVLTVTNFDNGCTLLDTTIVQYNCGPARRMPGTSDSVNSAVNTGGAFTFKAYPNPFSKNAFIEFKSPNADFVTVQLFNNNGTLEKLLFSNKVVPNLQYKLTISGNLPAGIHYFAISVNNRIYTKKIIAIK